MYVNPFLAGAVCTILGELAIAIIYCLLLATIKTIVDLIRGGKK